MIETYPLGDSTIASTTDSTNRYYPKHAIKEVMYALQVLLSTFIRQNYDLFTSANALKGLIRQKGGWFCSGLSATF